MDAFFMLWSFDSRWLFKIKNPCHQLIYTIPLLINVVSLGWTYIQKSIQTEENLPFVIEVIMLLALLAISNLYMICIIRMNSAQKLSNIKENYVTIENFYHDYQNKKVVWSLIGLVITILTIALTFIQSIFIHRNQKIYPCLANKFRYYLDIAFYAYILAMVVIFIVVKAVYLLSAWVACPQVYLKIKKIID